MLLSVLPYRKVRTLIGGQNPVGEDGKSITKLYNKKNNQNKNKKQKADMYGMCFKCDDTAPKLVKRYELFCWEKNKT